MVNGGETTAAVNMNQRLGRFYRPQIKQTILPAHYYRYIMHNAVFQVIMPCIQVGRHQMFRGI